MKKKVFSPIVWVESLNDFAWCLFDTIICAIVKGANYSEFIVCQANKMSINVSVKNFYSQQAKQKVNAV